MTDSSDLETRAAGLPAPPPDQAMLERVLAARMEGRRVLLPGAEGNRPLRPWLTAGLVAASVTALLIATNAVRSAPGKETSSRFTHIGFLPNAAVAQTGPVVLTRRLPPLSGIRGDRITPGTWVYELVERRHDGVAVVPERARMRLLEERIGNRRVWVLESGFLGHEHDLQERTTYDYATLRPLRRSASNVGHSRFRVEQQFRGDSLLGSMSTRQRSTPIARRLDAADGPFIAGEASLMLLLRALVLQTGLEGSAAAVGWGAVRSDLLYPINLRVSADDGDSWRIVARTGRQTMTFWSRKRDGVVVRVRQDTQSSQFEVRLVEESL